MNTTSRKEQIKSVAARLFRKRGFTATSVRDIAAEMNMEAPSLYNHIKGKQSLLQELLLEIAEAFTQGMNTISGSSLAAKEKLERLIKLHVDITVSHADSISLLTNDWVHLEEPAFSRYISMRDEYETAFREILQDALHNNGDTDVDIDIALFSILSTLRWLYSWHLKNPDVNTIELEKQMVRNLLTGLLT